MFPSLHYPDGLLRSFFSPLFKGLLLALLFVLVSGLPLRAQDDDPMLINIENLAQLNAMRWDLDGDGLPVGEGLEEYKVAFGVDVEADEFPDSRLWELPPPVGLQFPPGTTGYRLMADLNFDDMNNDGTSDDPSPWSKNCTGNDCVTGTKVDGTEGSTGWEPIGPSAGSGGSIRNRFIATFEGNGHTISNLYMNKGAGTDYPGSDESKSYTGFFGAIEEQSVSNLGLLNVDIQVKFGSFEHHVGALAGQVDGSSETNISNCYSTGKVSYLLEEGGLKFGIIGGLVGSAPGATLLNCHSACTVTSNSLSGSGATSGGLIGRGSVTATHCYATGDVFARVRAGGLIGSGGGSINKCYATGHVTQQGEDIGSAGSEIYGGLVGSASGKINDSYATGNVTAINRGHSGGLVGTGENLSINKCYAVGDVRFKNRLPTENNYQTAGGLVGRLDDKVGSQNSIKASYALGSLYGADGERQDGIKAEGGLIISGFGGLVGNFDKRSSITNSYCIGGIEGGPNQGALVGVALGEGEQNIRHCYYNTDATDAPAINPRMGRSEAQRPMLPSSSRGLTAAELQTPTAYEGIYAEWDTDNPWDFCGTDQYPKLKVDFDDDGTPSANEFGNRNSCGSDTGGGDPPNTGGGDPPGTGNPPLSVREDTDVLLYPNPASGTLRLAGLEVSKNYSYSVYNLAGKTLQQGVLQGDQAVDVSTLAAGSYVFLLQSAGTEVLRSRVIIRK